MGKFERMRKPANCFTTAANSEHAHTKADMKGLPILDGQLLLAGTANYESARTRNFALNAHDDGALAGSNGNDDDDDATCKTCKRASDLRTGTA
jgi:hypothetical protein